MPSVQINVYRPNSTSRSRSTGRRQRRSDDPPHGWIGTREPPSIWRGASMMQSVARERPSRNDGHFESL